MPNSNQNTRNIAIIAHVDHGKTTLVDGLLKQTNTFRDNQAEMNQSLIMDSGDQEKERGITITAKITAVNYHDYKINIIDTPGHADFGGEVERTLHMADGCLLVVDAQEGPMPQTKFVLAKALEKGLSPILVINKIDKPGSRISEVESEVADLFLELATDERQLDYPTIYAVAREGKAWINPPADFLDEANLNPVFGAIVDYIPPPVAESGSLQMLISALDWDSYVGKYAIGKVSRGQLKSGEQVKLIKRSGEIINQTIDKVYQFSGLGRVESVSAIEGDIVALSGISEAEINSTITSALDPEALESAELEEPTLSMYFGPNTSPYKGTEGKLTTSRQIADRLNKELETNIGLRVEADGIGFKVSGRGELHLSVLIEAMRREGFELEVGRPHVVISEEAGVKYEPQEEVTALVDKEYLGAAQSEFGKRRAELIDQKLLDDGSTRLTYSISTRGLLGLRTILMATTKGTVSLSSVSAGRRTLSNDIKQLRGGALIAWENGNATPFALQLAEARGQIFIEPGAKVYMGQVVGLNSRSDDMDINVVKEKHLTNMRSKGSDGAIQLTPATILSLEQCIDFLEDDELLEVTPDNLRLRKRYLDRNQRKKKQIFTS